MASASDTLHKKKLRLIYYSHRLYQQNNENIARVGRNASANYAFVPSNTGNRDWYVHVTKGAREFTEPEILSLLPQERVAEAPEPEPESTQMCGGFVGETETGVADEVTYSFMNIYSTTDEPNYLYRAYNATTHTFNSIYDSSIAIADYTIDDTITTETGAFVIRYLNSSTNEFVFHIVSADGDLLQEISQPDSIARLSDASHDVFTCAYIDGSDDVQVSVYKISTDTLETFTITTTATNINTIKAYFENTMHIVITVAGRRDAYLYTMGDVTPTLVFNAASYSFTQVTNPKHVAVTYNDTGSYVTELLVLYQSGTIARHDLSGQTYENSASACYGIENSMYWFAMNNDTSGLVDYLVVNATPADVSGEGPIIVTKTAIQTNNVTRIYNNDYYESVTGASNNFALLEAITTMNSISDGGNDMFDDGNFISFTNGTITATDIIYGTTSEDADYGYFVAEGLVYPHLAVAYTDTTAAMRWSTRGNLGADGSGTISNSNGTYTCSNGRTGSWWLNTTRGAGDPSVGELWFTVEKTEWGSTINSTSDGRKVSNTDSYNHFFQVTGTNFFFCKALISRTSGANISTVETETFLTAYIEDLPLVTSANNFATVDLSGMATWYYANSSTYISNFTNFFSYAYDGAEDPGEQITGSLHVFFDGEMAFESEAAVTDVFSASFKFNVDTLGYIDTSGNLLRGILLENGSQTEITLATDADSVTYTVARLHPLHRRFIFRAGNGAIDRTYVFAVNIVDQELIDSVDGDTDDDFEIVTQGRYAIINFYGDTNVPYLFTGCGFLALDGDFRPFGVLQDRGDNLVYTFEQATGTVTIMSPDGYRQTRTLSTEITIADAEVSSGMFPGGCLVVLSTDSAYEFHVIDLSRNYTHVSGTGSSLSINNIFVLPNDIIINFTTSSGRIIRTYSIATGVFSDEITDAYTFSDIYTYCTYQHQPFGG